LLEQPCQAGPKLLKHPSQADVCIVDDVHHDWKDEDGDDWDADAKHGSRLCDPHNGYDEPYEHDCGHIEGEIGYS